jgi:hypothetical protein
MAPELAASELDARGRMVELDASQVDLFGKRVARQQGDES